MRDRVMGGVAHAVPFFAQQRFKALGLFRLLHGFFDKQNAELLFQREWAVEFKQNWAKS